MRQTMVAHRFFNRHGGSSRDSFASLNVSFGTGDSADLVRRNRQHVKLEMGIQRLISGVQVHGSRIYVDDDSPAADVEVERYDGLITNRPDTALMIQQADCQAVLLYDEVHHAIGAAHCGWRGSVVNIIDSIVTRMTELYDTNPSGLQAWISPSLGPCCAEFINYRTELPESFYRFQVKKNYFDFWHISRDQLIQTGVRPDAIELPDVCTCCSDEYFSYRRAVRERDGICGRQASVICLGPLR